MFGLLFQHILSYTHHAANAGRCLWEKPGGEAVLPSSPRPRIFFTLLRTADRSLRI